VLHETNAGKEREVLESERRRKEVDVTQGCGKAERGGEPLYTMCWSGV